MIINAELAQLGEPPVDRAEEILLSFLDQVVTNRSSCGMPRAEDSLAAHPELIHEGVALVQAAECIEDFVGRVLEQSDLQPDALPATEPYGPLPDPFPELFRIRQFLGEGRFSRVWLAEHLRLDIPVALKTLHFEATGEERALVLTALRNEARILARLEHPNVVRVYGLEQSGEEHYLVLQYVDGGSLQNRLDRDGPLEWQLAARYIADVGEALLHVHAGGVVHRDIKLANILWDRKRDEALLTDFGIATRLADAHHVAGTPLFMAPEAFSGQCSTAGDVYGLAAALFMLVTGRAPFLGVSRAQILANIHQGLPDPEPLLTAVPERIDRIIRSGLAVAPAERPELRAFVSDLRGSLNRLLADSLVLQPAGPVQLRLNVARWEGKGRYVAVPGTLGMTKPSWVMTRDMTRVPPEPERVVLRTGDRVRVDVQADLDGYFTVFNLGPTGTLNLLYPTPEAISDLVPANQPLHVTDVALTPPAGNERLFAVWSRAPLSLEKAVELTRGNKDSVSPSYRATRNMERMQESMHMLRREDWQAAVLELDHLA